MRSRKDTQASEILIAVGAGEARRLTCPCRKDNKDPMEARDSFGYWVRRQRKSLDLTQEELAQRVGCALVTLRKIEADERRPSMQMAERLAQCLAVPTSEWPGFVAAAMGRATTTWLDRPPLHHTRLPGNLPAPVTALVGREREITAITACLQREDIRLLTLTGPVGVGKTRLAVEAGHRVRGVRDGVYLVELAPVRSVDLVLPAIATTFGVREGRRDSLPQLLADYLAARQLVLILDNFEHLLPATSAVASLLAACLHLKIVVTSRARLHLYGEYELVVPPLLLPETDDPVCAAESAAVRLFCDRAQAARTNFYLTPSSTPTVAAICRHLDGLPLAIELAAARIRLFSPQELLQRLGASAAGALDASAPVPRLRVLEHAIAWSYGLLTPAQQKLLARLAVFAGGFSLTAAQAICAPLVAGEEEAQDIADGVNALLDQSLVVREGLPSLASTFDRGAAVTGQNGAHDGIALTLAGEGGAAASRCCPHCPVQMLRDAAAAESRFNLLETIREFALDRLRDDRELALFRQRHAVHFAASAGRAAMELHGAAQTHWLAWLERNRDNLRAALSWLLDDGQVEQAAHMCCALALFWQRHGHYDEGRRWLDRVLAAMAGQPLDDTLHATTLRAAAMLAYRQGDWRTAQPLLAESQRRFAAAGDRVGQARVLFDCGWIAIDQGEWTNAAQLNRASLALAQTAGDRLITYQAMTNLGWTYLCLGDPAAAAPLFEEAGLLARQMEHTKGVAVSLINLGWIALYERNASHTLTLAEEGLRLCCQLGERELMAECIGLLALATLYGGDVRRAARLSGAADALQASLHILRPALHHAAVAHSNAVEAMQTQLGAADFADAWQAGRSLSLEAMVVYALGCRRPGAGVGQAA